MPRYRIAWLPGDGVGREVMDATRLVLDAVHLDAVYQPGDIGWEFWRREGDAFPGRTIDLLKHVDAALFGAVTSKPTAAAEADLDPELKGRGLSYRSPVVRMRQLFDLYVCLRPCKAYPGNPLNFREELDLVVFRENTEDLYSGVEFSPVPAELSATLAKLAPAFSPFRLLPADAYAVSCKINTRKGSSRIARAAFEFAKANGRKKVTIVHKANILKATSALFLETGRQVAKEYEGTILCEDKIVDNTAMQLVINPGQFDVIVTTNLFGDILSDLAAGLIGGLGLAPGANIGSKAAIFEAVHGSAPDIAGKGVANPTAQMLAAAMMLDHIGELDAGQRLRQAIETTIVSDNVRTRDLGGRASTAEFASAVAARA